jgi:accessory colonization factor AcfC
MVGVQYLGVSNPDIGQIIPIEPELVIYRDAGVALTQHSLKNPEAKSFVTFLSSPQGMRFLNSLVGTNECLILIFFPH